MTWPRMAWLKTGTRKKQTHWELLEREIMSWKKDEKGENMENYETRLLAHFGFHSRL